MPEGDQQSGDDVLFGGDSHAGRKAEDVLREELTGEDVLFGKKDPVLDAVASGVLNEKSVEMNEIVVADRPETFVGVVDDEVEPGGHKNDFSKVRDRLESLGNKFVREDSGRVRLILDSLVEDGLRFNVSEVENIEYFGDDVKRVGSGINKRIDVTTAASVVEDNVGADGTKFDTVDKAKTFLRKIGVRFEGDPDIVIEEEGDEVVAEPVVENLKEKTEDLINNNHLEISDLLMAKDFDENEFDSKYALIYRLIKSSKYDWAKKMGERLDENNYEEREVYEMARVIYLVSIMGEKAYRDIREKSNTLKDVEKNTGTVDTLGRERQTKYIISKANIVASSDLSDIWESDDLRLNNLKNYLERTFNKSEILVDKSPLGEVFSLMGKDYVDGTRFNMLAEGVLKSERREIMESVSNFREFANLVNSNKPPKEIPFDKLARIDQDLKRVIDLKNKGGVNVVPEVIVIYDQVLRSFAGIDLKKPVSIDSENVRKEVKRRLVASGISLSSGEVDMLVVLGRDVCGVLGIDAQCFYAREQNPANENKYDALPYGTRGVLMSEALNIADMDIKNNPDIPESAYEHMKIGVVPFYNKLSGSDETKSVQIRDASDLHDKIMTLPMGTEYQNWINNVIGASSAVKAERTMMVDTKDPIGQLKLIMSEYNYFGPGKPGYLQERVKDMLNAFLDKRRANGVFDVDTVKFLSGLYMEFGFFPDDQSLNNYLLTMNLPEKDDPDEKGEAEKLLSGLYGDSARKNFIKKGGATRYYERNPRRAFEAAKDESTWGNFFKALFGSSDE